MKLGTPGFQGKRLRQARISLGLTQESLALMLGYQDAQSVSALEVGGDTPSPEIMQRILTITRQPMHFFTAPLDSDLENQTVLFRSMRSLDEISRARAEVSLMWLAEYVRFLEKYVDFPEINLPDFSDIPKDIFEISDGDIRSIATRLRDFWGLGKAPLPNLINLLESNGFIIHLNSYDSHNWDAISYWDKITGNPLILVNTDKESYFRVRFTILHELFHLLFHQNLDMTLKKTKAYQKELERQANLFAGEMALPFDAFPKDLFAHSLDALRVIKSKWRVSIASMIYRMDDLGIIKTEETKRMWANYRRRWRDGEPLEGVDLEEPTIINSTINLLDEGKVLNAESLLLESIFSQEIQEEFSKMGDEFWQMSRPQLKIHKLFG